MFKRVPVTHRIRGEQKPGLPGSFPPHDPDYPDVDPDTGDERETTEDALSAIVCDECGLPVTEWGNV